jgi:hypothetical protein
VTGGSHREELEAVRKRLDRMVRRRLYLAFDATEERQYLSLVARERALSELVQIESCSDAGSQ